MAYNKRAPRLSRAERTILTTSPGTLVAVKSIPTPTPGHERDREFNATLRTWKSRLRNSGNIIRAKEITEFEKPSVKRRKKRLTAIRQQKFVELEEK